MVGWWIKLMHMFMVLGLFGFRILTIVLPPHACVLVNMGDGR
jgi:hypothetical protein